MNPERDLAQQEEMRQEEERIIEEFKERYRARAYSQVFYAPGAAWRVEGLFEDSFYRSARLLLQAVIDGKILPAEGVAAVFLCRHYLELALKFALFHSRWLAGKNTNASREEIAVVANTHDLKKLWDTLRAELSARVPSVLKEGLDLDFVGHLVEEFHQIDGKNWRFRYPVERIAVSAGPARLSSELGIDFPALLAALEHSYEVLSGLDSYLVETHGMNEEWESILSSF